MAALESIGSGDIIAIINIYASALTLLKVQTVFLKM